MKKKSSNRKIGEILISNEIIKIVSLIYIILPIIVFLFGFIKIGYAILCTVLLLVASYFLLKNMKKNEYKIKLKYIVISFFISFMFCFFAGHGYNFTQTWDFHGRNAIFRDLVNENWPVIYTKSDTTLVYYICQWMVPALFGKIVNCFNANISWQCASYALLIWNSIGISLALTWLGTNLKLKKTKEFLISNFAFLLFSGLDILGITIFNLNIINHLEWWAFPFQFSSMTTQIFWVFNQIVVPWLIIMMIINEKDNGIKNYAALGILMLPYGPFPLLGIVILLLSKGVGYIIKWFKEKDCNRIFKEIFSIQNILMIIVLLPIYYLYYSANLATNGDGGIRLLDNINMAVIIQFIVFYIIEVGLYLWFIRKYHKKDILYYVIVISLLIIPFIRIGNSYDFGMRVSIPALVMIDFWVLKILFDNKADYKVKNALVVLLIIGSLTSFTEIFRSINVYKNNKGNPENYLSDDWKTLTDKNPDKYDNFYSRRHYKKTNYYKYIMKR